MTKPLTKALHTVRVIRAVAEHLATISADDMTPDELLDWTLSILENERPTDPTLLAACLKACETAYSEARDSKMYVYVQPESINA